MGERSCRLVKEGALVFPPLAYNSCYLNCYFTPVLCRSNSTA